MSALHKEVLWICKKLVMSLLVFLTTISSRLTVFLGFYFSIHPQKIHHRHGLQNGEYSASGHQRMH